MPASRIAQAYVQVIPTMGGAEAALASQFGAVGTTAGTQMGKTMGGGILAAAKGFAGPLAAVFAVGGIAELGRSMVENAKTEIESNARIKNIAESMGIFGANTADVTQRLLDYAQATSLGKGIDEDSIKVVQAKLLTFKNIATSAGDMGGMFDRATMAAQDLASAGFGSAESNATALGKAMNDPVKGIMALARSGVTFTESEKDMVKAMVEAGDLAGAQELVMKAIETQVGGTAAATSTAADRMGQSWENLSETLGLMLIPALETLADIGAAAFSWIADNIGWLLPLAGIITGIAVAMAIYNGVMAFSTGIATAYAAASYGVAGATYAAGLAQKIGALAYAIMNSAVVQNTIALFANESLTTKTKLAIIASTIATQAATAAQWLWNAALNANPIGIIIIAIIGLVAALVWFFTQTELGKQVWENITQAIGTAINWLWTQVIQPVVNWIVEAWNWLGSAIAAMYEDFIKPIFEAIGAIFQWIWDTIIHPYVSMILLIIGLWAALFTWLWNDVLQPGLKALGDAFVALYEGFIKPAIDWIIEAFKAMGDWFAWLWTDIIQPVMGFIGDVFMWLWDTVVMFYVNLIIDIINYLGSVFEWLYKNAIKPAFDAIGLAFDWIWKNVIKPVVDWISGAIKTIGDVVTSVFTGISNFIRDTFNGIIGIIKGPINAVIGFINTMIDGLNTIKIDIPDWVPEWGGKKIGFNIAKLPMLADGGNITGSGSVMVGEAGPEILNLPKGAKVTPLDKASGGTINYYAAPNKSLDTEQELFTAMRRAKVVAGW